MWPLGLNDSQESFSEIAFAVTSSPYIKEYSTKGSLRTSYTTTHHEAPNCAAYDAMGDRLVLGSSTAPRLRIYTFSSQASETNPVTMPGASVDAIAHSPSEDVFVGGMATTPFIYVCKKVGGTWTKQTDPSTLPGGAVASVAFSNDGVFCAVGGSGTNSVTVYRTADWSVRQQINTGTTVSAVTWSTSGEYLAVASTTGSPYITIYWVNRPTMELLSIGSPTAAPNYVRCMSFSRDDKYLAVGCQGSPRGKIYDVYGASWAAETVTALNETGTTNAVEWSPNGNYVTFAGTADAGGDYVHTLNTSDWSLNSGRSYAVGSEVKAVSYRHRWGERIWKSYICLHKNQAVAVRAKSVSTIAARDALTPRFGDMCYTSTGTISTTCSWTYVSSAFKYPDPWLGTDYSTTNATMDKLRNTLGTGSTSWFAWFMNMLADGNTLHQLFGPDGEDKKVADFLMSGVLFRPASTVVNNLDWPTNITRLTTIPGYESVAASSATMNRINFTLDASTDCFAVFYCASDGFKTSTWTGNPNISGYNRLFQGIFSGATMPVPIPMPNKNVGQNWQTEMSGGLWTNWSGYTQFFHEDIAVKGRTGVADTHPKFDFAHGIFGKPYLVVGDGSFSDFLWSDMIDSPAANDVDMGHWFEGSLPMTWPPTGASMYFGGAWHETIPTPASIWTSKVSATELMFNDAHIQGFEGAWNCGSGELGVSANTTKVASMFMNATVEVFPNFSAWTLGYDRTGTLNQLDSNFYRFFYGGTIVSGSFPSHSRMSDNTMRSFAEPFAWFAYEPGSAALPTIKFSTTEESYLGGLMFRSTGITQANDIQVNTTGPVYTANFLFVDSDLVQVGQTTPLLLNYPASEISANYELFSNTDGTLSCPNLTTATFDTTNSVLHDDTINYGVYARNCDLSSASLDSLYSMLYDRTSLSTATVWVGGNTTGLSGDTPSIATTKNWTVNET